MKFNRGQAAMEYLMTYGWALLVIVLVLGALLYLGVLNPQVRVQDTCGLPVGWECKVVSLSTSGKLTLRITNQNPMQVDASVACAPGTGNDATKQSYPSQTTLSPGQGADFSCSISGFTGRQIGDISNGEVFVKYKEAGSSVEKYIKGSYTAKVSTQ